MVTDFPVTALNENFRIADSARVMLHDAARDDLEVQDNLKIRRIQNEIICTIQNL